MIRLAMTCRDMKSNPTLWPHYSHLYARWMVGYKWYKMLMTCALKFNWCGDDNHWINSMQNKWLNHFVPAVFILEAIQEMVMINKWSSSFSPAVAQLVRDLWCVGAWVRTLIKEEKEGAHLLAWAPQDGFDCNCGPTSWAWLLLSAFRCCQPAIILNIWQI